MATRIERFGSEISDLRTRLGRRCDRILGRHDLILGMYTGTRFKRELKLEGEVLQVRISEGI